jgi:HTH-type transcriptional regulator/antitoxin HigA
MSILSINYFDQKTNHAIDLPISVFKKPFSQSEYDELEKILDNLIDEVRDDESHPLALVMEIIGENLEQYDNENHLPLASNIRDVDLVKYLMKSEGLTQKDLAGVFGSQGNVSKFLNGERQLGKTQLVGLKNLFNISADVFLECRNP